MDYGAEKKLPIENIGFLEIGGIGEMVYRAVRFSDYGMTRQNGKEWIVPEFPSPFAPVYAGTDYKLTGQDLLVNLCNLWRSLNNPDSKKNPKLAVIDWVKNNIAPYNIDELYEDAKELDPGTVASTLLQQDGSFEYEDFIHDLASLGKTFDYYHALNEVHEHGNTAEARNLYYEGRLDEGFPFMEKYRNIQTDEEYILKVNEDWKDHIVTLIGLFPDFRMRLKRDTETGRVMYGADVQSVFDIAWYTFSRILADDGPKLDDDMNYDYNSGSVLTCEICGRYFIRHSSRQKYCGDPKCKAEQNRRNRKAAYARKRSKDIEEKAKKKVKM